MLHARLIPLAIDDPMQNRFLQAVKTFFQKRDHHYEELTGYMRAEDCDEREDDDDEEVDETDEMQPRNSNCVSVVNCSIDWERIMLLTGKPGTGKTHCVKKTIRDAIEEDRNVLVATPTGFLASTYSAEFLQDIDTDIVHCLKYPVIHQLAIRK
jgi:Cdc6-like AAA superfamily ATPase